MIQFLNDEYVQRQIRRFAGVSTIPDLNHGDFYKIQIYHPPLVLQREFAAFVEKVDTLKECAKRSAEQMDVLYRSKLQEYFG